MIAIQHVQRFTDSFQTARYMIGKSPPVDLYQSYEGRTESHEQQFFVNNMLYYWQTKYTTLIYITFFVFPHNRHFFVHISPSVFYFGLQCQKFAPKSWR